MGDAYSVADPYLFTIAGWLGHDDVDLAEFGFVSGRGVNLGPVEAEQAVPVVAHEQPCRVEPWLGPTFGDVDVRPSALFGVPRERRVVDPQQLVVSGRTRIRL